MKDWMNKNKKFQKEQLLADGYEEIRQFYKEGLKNQAEYGNKSKKSQNKKHSQKNSTAKHTINTEIPDVLKKFMGV